jgi:alpha-tubulin suppressor-like RCC1 family protein
MRRRASITGRFTSKLLGLFASLMVWAGATACSDGVPTTPSEPGSEGQFAKTKGPLRVTPPQLTFTALAANATLSAASSNAGAMTVEVSTPACVSVSPRRITRSPAKFTATSTAPGSCTITVRDGGNAIVEVPVQVVPLLRGTLTAGDEHTCGLNGQGAAYCWGSNEFGQLGSLTNSGTENPNPAPLAVQGGITFTQLTAGGLHTCGLTGDGTAYCWGVNSIGQLGIEVNTDPRHPTPTPTAVNTALRFVRLDAGSEHTCGLTAGGVVYCWGSNQFGQLGIDGNLEPNPTPVQVPASVAFAQLATGETYNCALTSEGLAYCWGRNNFGQLGIEDNVLNNTPNPVPQPVSGNLVFTSIVAGSVQTCALTSAGAAYCWGSNERGELGSAATYEDSDPNTTPLAVDGNLVFSSLTAGRQFTCGVATSGDGYCWGTNGSGLLTRPAGSFVGSPTPLLLNGGLKFIQLTTDEHHACGVSTAGAAYCWGVNQFGQLGTTLNSGSGTLTLTPEAVSGGQVFGLP